MFGIAHIRRRLIVDADGPQCNEGSVDDEGYKRMKDRADEHNALAKKKEDREHGDYDVEFRSTVGCKSSSFTQLIL